MSILSRHLRALALALTALGLAAPAFAAGPSVAISPKAKSFKAGGGSGKLKVSLSGLAGTALVSARVSEGAEWLHLAAGSEAIAISMKNGKGTATLRYTVDPTTTYFPAPERGEIRVTVEGGSLTATAEVRQAGVACKISVSPKASSGVPPEGGTGSFAVAAPEGCEWALSGSPPWLELSTAASGDGPGAIGYTVAPNPAGARGGSVTVRATNAKASAVFKLSQSAGPPKSPATVDDFVGTWHGTWEGQLEGRPHSMKVTVRLWREGVGLAGTYEEAFEGTGALPIAGNVSAGKFAWDVPAKDPDHPDCSRWDLGAESSLDETRMTMALHYFGTVCGYPTPGEVDGTLTLARVRTLTLADLAGTWGINTTSTGGRNPYWGRGTVTIGSDGSFSGTVTDNRGGTGTGAGTFSLSPDGTFTKPDTPDQTRDLRCSLDAGLSVFVCTETSSQGTPATTSFTVLTRKASSYAQADMAGTWGARVLAVGDGAPWWERGDLEVTSKGSLSGTLEQYDSPPDPIAARLSISLSGKATMVGNPTWEASLDAGKSVLVGTSNWQTGTPNTVDYGIILKKAADYSLADLVGGWHLNAIASGQGAPWWARGYIAINGQGTLSGLIEYSDGGSELLSMQITVDSDGTIRKEGSAEKRCTLDSGKTIVACVGTWSTGPVGTSELSLWTKRPY